MIHVPLTFLPPLFTQSGFVFLIIFRRLPLAEPIHYLLRAIGLHRSMVVLYIPNSSDFRVCTLLISIWFLVYEL